MCTSGMRAARPASFPSPASSPGSASSRHPGPSVSQPAHSRGRQRRRLHCGSSRASERGLRPLQHHSSRRRRLRPPAAPRSIRPEGAALHSPRAPRGGPRGHGRAGRSVSLRGPALARLRGGGGGTGRRAARPLPGLPGSVTGRRCGSRGVRDPPSAPPLPAAAEGGACARAGLTREPGSPRGRRVDRRRRGAGLGLPGRGQTGGGVVLAGREPERPRGDVHLLLCLTGLCTSFGSGLCLWRRKGRQTDHCLYKWETGKKKGICCPVSPARIWASLCSV